jgi:hypothetical protein
MQHLLKSAAGSTREWIIPTELFEEFLVDADDAITALYVSFGREALSARPADLESNWLRGIGARGNLTTAKGPPTVASVGPGLR